MLWPIFLNIKVSRKYGDNEQYLEDIILHSISDDEVNRLVIKAESGEVRNNNDNFLQLVLKNGNRYEDLIGNSASEKQKYPHSRASFDEYILNIDISDFNNIDLDEENYKSTYKMQKVDQLRKSSDTLYQQFEEDKLTFCDYNIISELTTFIQRKQSFEEEEGCNDDLAMCLVIFAWLVAQDYFKEMSDNDIRKRLYEEQRNQIEQDMAPFGFMNDGLDETSFVDKDGDRWNLDEYGDRSYMWDYM